MIQNELIMDKHERDKLLKKAEQVFSSLVSDRNSINHQLKKLFKAVPFYIRTAAIDTGFLDDVSSEGMKSIKEIYRIEQLKVWDKIKGYKDLGLDVQDEKELFEYFGLIIEAIEEEIDETMEGSPDDINEPKDRGPQTNTKLNISIEKLGPIYKNSMGGETRKVLFYDSVSNLQKLIYLHKSHSGYNSVWRAILKNSDLKLTGSIKEFEITEELIRSIPVYEKAEIISFDKIGTFLIFEYGDLEKEGSFLLSIKNQIWEYVKARGVFFDKSYMPNRKKK